MKECPICHTQYDDPLNFCTKDGHQLKSVETSHVETQKHENRQNNQHREKKGKRPKPGPHQIWRLR